MPLKSDLRKPLRKSASLDMQEVLLAEAGPLGE